MQNRRTHSAEDWFARKLSDDLSAEEQACFDQWLTNPANAENYHATAGVWEQAKFAQSHFSTTTEQQPTLSKTRLFWLNWPAAAAASLLLGIAVLLSLDSSKPDYSAEMATTIGERHQVELPDGTIIELGVNSRLSVDFQDDQRNVRLAYGEAYFKVAHNKERPFNVISNGHVISVVGTAFNVNARSGMTKILLVEGAVRIDPDKEQPLLLKPGEQTEFTADSPPAAVTRGNSAIALAWRSGKAVFVDTPLSEVIESFGNYHARQIDLDPSAIRLRVSGVIPIEDGAVAMDTLQVLLPITIEDTGDAYLIQAKP